MIWVLLAAGLFCTLHWKMQAAAMGREPLIK